jgi:hypothetical protein
VQFSYQKVIINDNFMVRLDHEASQGTNQPSWPASQGHMLRCADMLLLLGTCQGIKKNGHQLKMISASPLL